MKLPFVSAGVAALLLAGCATVPPGPALPAMPGTGKSLEQFQADDAICRGYASNAVAPSVQGSNDSAANTTAAATVIAAAAGALIGAASGNAGQGAAIGAGTGLLFGSASAGNAYGYYGQAQVQRSYDVYYSQCMYARGNRVPAFYSYQEAPRPASPPPAPTLPGTPPPGTPPPPAAAPALYPPLGTPPPPGVAPPAR